MTLSFLVIYSFKWWELQILFFLFSPSLVLSLKVCLSRGDAIEELHLYFWRWILQKVMLDGHYCISTNQDESCLSTGISGMLYGHGNWFWFLIKCYNVLRVKRMLFIHDMVLRKHWLDKLLSLEWLWSFILWNKSNETLNFSIY